MIFLYRYGPAWDMPCFSPFVTKVAYYLQMARIPYELIRQDPSRLADDAPYGKLPFIVDDGTKVADSTTIIGYLEKKFGGRMDGDATPSEKAQMLAWNRLIDEHTYWCAVVQPRWREQANFDIYVPIIFGAEEVPPAARQFIEGYREIMLSQFLGQGMGKLPGNAVYQRARTDIDAVSVFLDEKPFFMGNRPRSIDATLLSILKQILRSPFNSDTKEYTKGKRNLVDYCTRLEKYIENQGMS